MCIPWPQLIAVFGSLGGAFGGAWLGQKIARNADRQRTKKRDLALLDALMVEVEHGASHAKTYLDEGILAPAYRVQHKIYDTALPMLVGSALDADAVDALIGFYSQVDQVNYGLDMIAANVRTDANVTKIEHDRLLRKCDEMKRPQSRFYTTASEALKRCREAVASR